MCTPSKVQLVLLIDEIEPHLAPIDSGDDGYPSLGYHHSSSFHVSVRKEHAELLIEDRIMIFPSYKVLQIVVYIPFKAQFSPAFNALSCDSHLK